MLSDAAFACVRVRAILTHFSGERPGTQGLPRRPPVIHRNSGDPQRSSFGRFRGPSNLHGTKHASEQHHIRRADAQGGLPGPALCTTHTLQKLWLSETLPNSLYLEFSMRWDRVSHASDPPKFPRRLDHPESISHASRSPFLDTRSALSSLLVFTVGTINPGIVRCHPRRLLSGRTAPVARTNRMIWREPGPRRRSRLPFTDAWPDSC